MDDATVSARLALTNWSKYAAPKDYDEVVYQANKVARALEDVLAGPFARALETLLAADDKRQREDRNPETPREKAAHVVICYLAHVRDGRL